MPPPRTLVVMAVSAITEREGREAALILRRYARDRDPVDLERLVMIHRPLARGLARRYASASQLLEDLEQAAYEGLIKAIRRFRPELGYAFSTFAVPTILGELRRLCRDTAWPAHVPRPVQERLRHVRQVIDRLEATSDRTATLAAVADVLACDEEQVVEALCAASSRIPVPLDAQAPSDDGELTLADRIGEDDPAYEEVECLAVLEDAFPALDPTERTVLCLHFRDDLTQQQIAGRLGVSRAQVARDLGSGIARLRAAAAPATVAA